MQITAVQIATASFIIAASAFVVSILNFRRQRRIDIENHLFKTKAEDYKLLLEKITSVFKLFPTETELPELVKNADKMGIIAEQIDQAVVELSFFIIPHTIVLPPALVKSIEELIGYFIDGDFESQKKEGIIKEFEKAYKKVMK